MALKWRYWFDDAVDQSVVMPSTETSLMIDVDTLVNGVHNIHFQAMNDRLSEVKTQMFVKVPMDVDMDQMYCLVLVDNKIYSQEPLNMSASGVATFCLDVKDLSQGLHKIDIMAMTASGAMSTAYNSYFVRGFLGDESVAMKCLYSFDNETDYHETTYSDGVSHINLDVAHLDEGPHSIRWMLADREGAYVSDKRSWFIKMPLGGNALTSYRYWLNDADSVKHETVLTSPKNPYDLIALLPVETVPLRSSCFQFEVKDLKPMMYAKNDIHFMFTDKYGREANVSKQYVDYNVSSELTDVAELKSTQTFARPQTNAVKWFTFKAEKGDTIAFRASQATSLQVYSPSGNEIYAASGDKSVKYGGIHTWEDGVHYVAVHDVAGSKASITLDYLHMDKYDVVSQDVKVVGNGGCSTITFHGNGFRDLYAVDLYTAQGDVIHSAHIEHISDATITVRFNFTNAVIGEYKALFNFTEGEKLLNYCIRVEEAKDIKLSYDVKYASSFIRGTATTYTINVKNSGNSTAYQVPLKIQLQAQGGTKDITYIKLSDNLDFDYYSWLDDDSIPENKRLELLELVRQKGNMLDFISINDSIDGEEFMEGYFAINLPPNSTTTFTISVRSNSTVTVYTLLPDEWDYYAYSEGGLEKSKRIRKAGVKESMCCARTHVECIMNFIATGLDFASIFGGGWTIASCISSVANTVIPFAYDMWCGETSKDYIEGSLSLVKNIISAAISCASKYDPYKIGWAIQHVTDIISTGLGCIYHPKKLSSCPPTLPKPHSSTPVASRDPNEIYGYTHESGSKFINDSIQNVYYRIEFENDTAFATASAHVVEVTDTLDSKFFDLSTFAPTRVKIGDKVESLDGSPNFVKTIDMRPAINAIAQVEGKYDEKKGIAKWTFTSLDPMTMEPTYDVMQGFLPVNYDGESGIGEVMFDVSLKGGFADGTEIPNRASIVFDTNDPILTPTWVNTIDAVCPKSSVTSVAQKDQSTVTIKVTGSDERSGVWKYDFYAQYGVGSSWFKIGECSADSASLDFQFYEDIDYGFCTIATDSAGNVEKKELARECSFYKEERGDVDDDGCIDVTDINILVSIILKRLDAKQYDGRADVNGDGYVDVGDISIIVSKILGLNKLRSNLVAPEGQRLRLRDYQFVDYTIELAPVQ